MALRRGWDLEVLSLAHALRHCIGRHLSDLCHFTQVLLLARGGRAQLRILVGVVLEGELEHSFVLRVAQLLLVRNHTLVELGLGGTSEASIHRGALLLQLELKFLDSYLRQLLASFVLFFLVRDLLGQIVL